MSKEQKIQLPQRNVFRGEFLLYTQKRAGTLTHAYTDTARMSPYLSQSQ